MSRLHREVMEQLIVAIASGTMKTGTLLPREVDLAQAYDVSRGVARETIRAMEERGLVQVRHGKGATVTDESHWDLLAPEVLQAMLKTNRGPGVLGQFIQTRQILEVEAAGTAAELAEDADITRMQHDLAAMEEVALLSEQGNPVAESRFHEADLAFHQSIFAAARNHVLASLVRRIHEALYIARLALARPQFRVERALPEHQAIFEAIKRGNPQTAREAMRAHLHTVADYLLESYQDLTPGDHIPTSNAKS